MMKMLYRIHNNIEANFRRGMYTPYKRAMHRKRNRLGGRNEQLYLDGIQRQGSPDSRKIRVYMEIKEQRPDETGAKVIVKLEFSQIRHARDYHTTN